MKLSKEIVLKLNTQLAIDGCAFRYVLIENMLAMPAMKITLPNSKFVESTIINLTKDGFDFVESFLKSQGIETVCCNNDGSIIWSGDFSDDDE